MRFPARGPIGLRDVERTLLLPLSRPTPGVGLRSSVPALGSTTSATWHAAPRIKADGRQYAADKMAPIFGKNMEQSARACSHRGGEVLREQPPRTPTSRRSSCAELGTRTPMSTGPLHRHVPGHPLQVQGADKEILDRYRFRWLSPRPSVHEANSGMRASTTLPAIRAAGVVLLRGSATTQRS